MSAQNTSVTTRITVRDTESKENTAWNDDYTLLVPSNDPPYVFRTFERATKRPDENYFRNENLSLDQVPGRVADVYDEYIDAAQVGLSPAGDAGRELEREDATVTVEEGGDTYTFEIFDRRHIRIRANGDRDMISNVPDSVQQAAEQHIPSGADYLGA